MSPTQLRMGRAALNLTLRDFAKAADITTNTVRAFENGLPVRRSTLARMEQVLRAGGVVFTEGDGVKLGNS